MQAGEEKPLIYAGFAILCKVLQLIIITRNEQASGSSPIVGSFVRGANRCWGGLWVASNTWALRIGPLPDKGCLNWIV